MSTPDGPPNTLEKIITMLDTAPDIRAWFGSALQPFHITAGPSEGILGETEKVRRQFVMDFANYAVTFTANMALGPDGDIVVSDPTDFRRIHKTPGGKP